MSSTDKSSGRGDGSWRLLAPASRSGMFLTLGAAAPNSPRSSQPHRVGLPPVARRSAGLPRINRPDAVTAFTWLGCGGWKERLAAKMHCGLAKGNAGHSPRQPRSLSKRPTASKSLSLA